MNWWQKNRWNLLIILALAAFWLGWWLLPRLQQPVIISEIEITSSRESKSPLEDSQGEEGLHRPEDGNPYQEDQLAEMIVVHVGGAVVKPGVYQLAAGSRAVDGILAAGGSADSAALDLVNLARPLSDGEQLIIPAAGDNPGIDLSISSKPAGTFPPAAKTAESGLINLNRAGVAELITLPGIGEVRAQAILDYREEMGPFKSPEDLIAVPGIGPTILAGLLDQVEAP